MRARPTRPLRPASSSCSCSTSCCRHRRRSRMHDQIRSSALDSEQRHQRNHREQACRTKRSSEIRTCTRSWRAQRAGWRIASQRTSAVWAPVEAAEAAVECAQVWAGPDKRTHRWAPPWRIKPRRAGSACCTCSIPSGLRRTPNPTARACWSYCACLQLATKSASARSTLVD